MTPAAIRSLRKRLGLSANAFAQAIGLTGKNAHVTVYRWERDICAPGQFALYRMKEIAFSQFVIDSGSSIDASSKPYTG